MCIVREFLNKMTILGTLSIFTTLLFGLPGGAFSLKCAGPLSSAYAGSDTQSLINIFRILAVEKNALSERQIQTILDSAKPFNPVSGDRSLNLSSTETYVVKKAIDKILDGQDQGGRLDWNQVKAATKEFGEQSIEKEAKRSASRKKTKVVLLPIVLDRNLLQSDISTGPENILKYKSHDGSTYLAFTGGRIHSSTQGEAVLKLDEKRTVPMGDHNNSKSKDFLETENGIIYAGYSILGEKAISIFNVLNGRKKYQLPLAHSFAGKWDWLNPPTVHILKKANGDMELISSWKESGGELKVIAADLKTETTDPIPLPDGNYKFFKSADARRLYAYGSTTQSNQMRVIVSDLASQGEIVFEKVIPGEYPQYRSNDSVGLQTDFFETRKGDLYLAVRNRGLLYIFGLSDGTSESYEVNPDHAVPLGGFFETQDGRILFMTPHSESIGVIDVRAKSTDYFESLFDYEISWRSVLGVRQSSKMAQLKDGSVIIVSQQLIAPREQIIQITDIDKKITRRFDVSEMKLDGLVSLESTADGGLDGVFGARNAAHDGATNLARVQLIGALPQENH